MGIGKALSITTTDADDVLEQAKGKNRKFVFISPILSGSLVTVKMTECRKRLYLSNNGSAINFRRQRSLECIIIATSVDEFIYFK